MSVHLQKTIAHWGEDLPEWVKCLAIECDNASQNQIAKRLNRSGSMISQVLHNKYEGNLTYLKDQVEGLFMAEEVNCPALGFLPLNTCSDWRARTKKQVTNANSQQVTMYRACTRCPINKEL